jgi:hypothetical protein
MLARANRILRIDKERKQASGSNSSLPGEVPLFCRLTADQLVIAFAFARRRQFF